MKRFRISATDEISANVYHNGKLIATLYDSGFTTIEGVKCQILNKLGWPWKGYGRKLEIGIYNRTKEQSKYINTFS